MLDACLDTAPFGDEAAWTYPPASGQITRGWLHGRGSADSKAGAAIFAHVAARLQDTAGGLGGSVVRPSGPESVTLHGHKGANTGHRRSSDQVGRVGLEPTTGGL